MNKKTISLLLKKYRSQSGLSVADVLTRLNQIGISISEKTLYGYENGVSLPNIPTFIALCDMYDISDIIGAVNESALPHINSSALAVNDWNIDQYNDFFDADLYEKIVLLIKWGIPSFSGYESKLQAEFYSDSKSANFSKLYSNFSKLDEYNQGLVFLYIDNLLNNEHAATIPVSITKKELALLSAYRIADAADIAILDNISERYTHSEEAEKLG